jgi:redox-regulated HSP33 family molecular chaperone
MRILCVLDELLTVVTTLEGQSSFENVVMSISDHMTQAIINFLAKSESITSAASLDFQVYFLSFSLQL